MGLFRNRPLKRKKDQSVIRRITLWYGFFIALLLVLVLALIFFIAGNVLERQGISEMKKKGEEIARHPEKFEPYDDGAYFVVLDPEGRPIKGRSPISREEPFSPEEENLKEVKKKGERYLVYTVKTEKGRYVQGILPKNTYGKELLGLGIGALITAPLVFLSAVFGGRRILKKAFMPLEEIMEIAEDIEGGENLSLRIPVGKRDDEFRRLTNTLNRMLERMEKSFLREKQFSHDVSHELRTPLAVILGEAEYALTFGEDPEENRRAFLRIHDRAIQMRALIQQLLEWGKSQEGAVEDPVKVDPGALLAPEIPHYVEEGQKQGIVLSFSREPDLGMMGQPLLLLRLMDNLISNTIKFGETYGNIRWFSTEDRVIFQTENDGKPISPEDLEKIWDPFFQGETSRNKGKNQGVGLGLSFVRKITALHRGTVEVRSAPGKTVFTVSFPKIKS